MTSELSVMQSKTIGSFHLLELAHNLDANALPAKEECNSIAIKYLLELRSEIFLQNLKIEG